MTSEQTAYYLFITACGIMSVVPIPVATATLLMMRKHRQRRTASVEAQVSQAFAIVALFGAMLLVPIGAYTLNHVLQLTPEQFVQEFRSAQHPQR